MKRKQLLTGLKRDINNNTIVVEDFNSPFIIGPINQTENQSGNNIFKRGIEISGLNRYSQGSHGALHLQKLDTNNSLVHVRHFPGYTTCWDTKQVSIKS